MPCRADHVDRLAARDDGPDQGPVDRPRNEVFHGRRLVHRGVERDADHPPDDGRPFPGHAPRSCGQRGLELGERRLALRAADGARGQGSAGDSPPKRIDERATVQPRREEPRIERVARPGGVDRGHGQRGHALEGATRAHAQRARRAQLHGHGPDPGAVAVRERACRRGHVVDARQPRPPRRRWAAGRPPRRRPRRTRRPSRRTDPSWGRGSSSARRPVRPGTAPARPRRATAGGSSSRRGGGARAPAGRPGRRMPVRRRSFPSRSGSPGRCRCQG